MHIVLNFNTRTNMFDKLSSLFSDEVKDVVQAKLVDNEGLSKNASADAVKAGTASIFESLKDELLAGNLNEIMGAFKNPSGNLLENPIIKSLISKAVGKLMGSTGFDSTMAETIIKNTLPAVIGKVVKKDADDSPFSLDSMLGVLKGDKKEDGLMGDMGSTITKGLSGFF